MRILAGFSPVIEVDSCAAATEVVRKNRKVRAFILDDTLPDGSGLDWLAFVRRTHRATEALVLTARCEHELVNRAVLLRARFACKPLPGKELRRFAQEAAGNAMERECAQRQWIRSVLAKVSLEKNLTAKDSRIVEAALRGEGGRSELAASGINPNTLKSRVRRALKKLGAKSLRDVRKRAASDT